MDRYLLQLEEVGILASVAWHPGFGFVGGLVVRDRVEVVLGSKEMRIAFRFLLENQLEPNPLSPIYEFLLQARQ